MNHPDLHATRRLARLERVLHARRERLDERLSPAPRPAAGLQGAIQLYGYPVALLLAATALLPGALGLMFKHRKAVGAAASMAIQTRRWRRWMADVRPVDGEP